MIKRYFSFSLIFFSIILFFYTFYKSEIIWEGTKRLNYSYYYYFTLFIFLFSLISFFLNEKIKIYFTIIFVSSLSGMYLFEFYKTFIYHDNKHDLKYKLYFEQTKKEYDKRSRFQIYNDLKKTNPDTYISIPSQTYLKNSFNNLFPLSGISNSKTLHCNENGYYSIYESDRYGFNNPDYEWDQNSIEYLLVGDSFTQGACVNRPNDIASRLREITDKSVLNLGKGGSGPLIEYATLKEYLSSKAKNILWFYYEGNDLFDLNKELKNKFLLKYLSDENFKINLTDKQDEINEFYKQIIQSEYEISKTQTKTSKYINFFKLFNTRLILFPQPEKKLYPSIELKNILKSASELSYNNGSNFYFVYLPTYERYLKKIDNDNIKILKDFTQDLNIPFINIHELVFQKENDPKKLFPFESPGHYNIEGYQKIALTINNFVNKND